MSRLRSSPAFVRARAVTGIFFVVFGVAIVVQTVLKVGLRPEIVPGVVMGLALIGLGATRVRTYLAFRRAAP